MKSKRYRHNKNSATKRSKSRKLRKLKRSCFSKKKSTKGRRQIGCSNKLKGGEKKTAADINREYRDNKLDCKKKHKRHKRHKKDKKHSTKKYHDCLKYVNAVRHTAHKVIKKGTKPCKTMKDPPFLRLPDNRFATMRLRHKEVDCQR